MSKNTYCKVPLDELDEEFLDYIKDKYGISRASFLKGLLRDALMQDEDFVNNHKDKILDDKNKKRPSEKENNRIMCIKVYCKKKGFDEITEKALDANLTYSTLLLQSVKNVKITGQEELKFKQKVIDLNADINRLGNLLKMMLSREEMYQGMYGIRLQHAAKELIDKLKDISKEIHVELIDKILKKKS